MKKTGWGAYAALTLWAFAAIPAHADETIDVPELLISAGVEPVPTKEVASSYTIITSEEIERHQYRTLPEALTSVPGIHVVQSGGAGAVTSVFSRGTNSNQTLVLLNGHPIGDPSAPTGGFNFADVTLDNVERIEVVRGPQSAFYGSQAIGGVINIITKTGAGGARTTARIEAGTLGTLNTNATTGGSFGASDYFFSLSRQATNGSDITPSHLRAQQGEPKEEDSYRNVTVAGSMTSKLSEYVSSQINVQYMDAHMDFDEGGSINLATPPFFASVYEGYNNEGRSKELFASGSLTGNFADGRWRPKLSASYTRYDRNIADDPDAIQPTYIEDIDSESERLTVAFENAYDLDTSQRLAFGASFAYESFKVTGFQDFSGFVITTDSDADTNSAAIYAADHLTFGERWFATVAGRYDMPKEFDDTFTYTLSAGYYHPETDTRLTASHGTGFKTPSLYDRFGFSSNNFGGTFTGNPNLTPEKSKSWEIGIDQGLMDGKVTGGITGFHNTIENAVLQTLTTAVNQPEFRTHGVETYIEINPFENLTARIDYTWTIIDSDFTGGVLTRRPRHAIGFTTAWQIDDRTTLSGAVNYIDLYRDIDRETGAYINPGSYTVVRIAGAHKLTEWLELTARVNNLLDRQYEPANGFQAAGIEALAGIAVTF